MVRAIWAETFGSIRFIEELKFITRNSRVNSARDVNNYNEFSQKPGLRSDSYSLEFGQGQRLNVHPFRSVSTNPLWMNLGSVTIEELDKLNSILGKQASDHDGDLHMLVLITTPFRLPKLLRLP